MNGFPVSNPQLVAALAAAAELLADAIDSASTANASRLDRIAAAAERIAASLEKFEKLIRPSTPVGLSAQVVAQRQGDSAMVLVFDFKAKLPPVNPDDNVVSRELLVKIGAAEPQSQSVAGATLEVGGYFGAEGAAVHLELVDVDQAGNRSNVVGYDFTIADTIPPHDPANLGAEVTGQREVPDA